MSSRIITVSGCPHPKAEVQRIDEANGTLVFAWLDAAGKRVDSGGSIARFTPVAGVEDPTTHVVTYAEVPDPTLIDAIENPPPQPAAPVRLTPLEVLSRLTQAEEAALTTSIDLAVAIVRQRFIAATYVDTSDIRTTEGIAILVAKGIITQPRAALIFA